MNEGAALRVLSFLNDSSQRHVASLVNEKRKVTVIGEEHEPDEIEIEEPLPSAIDEEADLLTPEQIKEFFKTAEEGTIERLDELFDTTANADPNMTQYMESLLMAAIRAKRYKMAEYLIDQLGINVNHTTNLLEFRPQTRIPVREQTISCRDLAYNKGMMDLVDLIDIVSDEVKPNIKRYLQRRLKTRLDQIHQSYLKRMKERNNRLIIPSQEKETNVLEENEQEKENEEPLSANIIDDIKIFSLAPPIPPVVHRPYKSHIEATMQSIESKNDKSIDESGKKFFRFSGYTLHYRLVETGNKNQQKKERSRPKTGIFSFPIIPPTSTRTLPPPSLSRPTTTATTTNVNRRSISEVSARIPIRETRTSICRSARHIATPRVAPTVTTESKPEITPKTITTINTTQRLLPKRIRQINTDYNYIPQLQNAVYNDPRHFMPVTLKTTSTGLLSDTRLIRD
ncbi:unnamed protein product [Rotaria sordida]|uniref:Uncharacterized protein n=1 Tax=Rotaria sordida TaxID=392033 RepID=A0A814IKL6_9BILA|nr:unnamed protein product [Rotaria sordida]CAF1353935.1 unnamed protein product [Rotaria sordida]CAF1603377.1 unnamed protein product [Rotaria sordida]CAF3492353.1 unnamed protein product [Rotaria sordida]